LGGEKRPALNLDAKVHPPRIELNTRGARGREEKGREVRMAAYSQKPKRELGGRTSLGGPENSRETETNNKKKKTKIKN